jgi:hypothetical protein
MKSRKMSDRDFEIWKASPHDFRNLHKGLLKAIIAKNSFVHQQGAERANRESEILQRMDAADVVTRLKAFSYLSTFVVFYIAIFREVVIAANQEEDIDLLKNDFNTLIVKYQPMVKMIACQFCLYHHLAEVSRFDVVQQMLTNLLGKREVILSTYDYQRLFRNFIWKVAENEAKNIIKTENKHNNHGVDITSHPDQLPLIDNCSTNDLAVGDAVKFLHCKVLAYLNLRFKVLFCLKVLFNHILFKEDFRRIVNSDDLLKEFDFDKVMVSLNSMDKSETGKLHRFEVVKPFLNLADQTTTDANSYWRWTNKEITKLICFLNSRLLTQFDRETFGSLLDQYFQKFKGDAQFSNEGL